MINPVDNHGQIAAENDVIALRQDERIAATRAHVERLWRNAWADRVPAGAEAGVAAMVDEYVNNWLFKAVASDSQHPRFVRNFMPPHSWQGHDVPGARTGGDNPDNCYRLAGIAHGTRYRVTGRPVGREPANTSFTLVGDYGTSVTIQTVENRSLERADDGSFVITIDDQPANGRRNHITTAPHAKFLYVRDSMEDWASETPYALEIERLGPAAADPISRDEMAQRTAFRARDDVPLYFWFQSTFTNMTPNSWKLLPMNRDTGGLVTQVVGRGWFDLGPDDAVIVDFEPGGSAYSAIQMGSWLFQSIEAHRRTSSLTRAQCVADGDGRIRMVIALQDPGVANWLDCAGHPQVMAMLRWQGVPPLTAAGDVAPGFSAKMIKLDDLRKNLPADTSWFTTAQREQQQREREAAFSRRYALNAGG